MGLSNILHIKVVQLEFNNIFQAKAINHQPLLVVQIELPTHTKTWKTSIKVPLNFNYQRKADLPGASLAPEQLMKYYF